MAPRRSSRFATALSAVFSCSSADAKCPSPIDDPEPHNQDSKANALDSASQDAAEVQLDMEEAAEADARWIVASGRALPLDMPVIFLSGAACCTLAVNTLDMRISELKAQIHERTGIPYIDQQLICEGAVSEMGNETTLRSHGDLLSKASYLQLVRREPEAVRKCILELADENVMVRTVACVELGRLGSFMGIDPLEKALTDPEWTVRQNAATALGKFKHAAVSCIPALEEVMRTDDDANVRMHAATALKGIGPAAIPALERALKEDADDIVRIRAAEALGKMMDESVIPVLSEIAMGDTSIHVRQAAADAMRTINRKEVSEPTQNERIAQLYKQLMKSSEQLECAMLSRQSFLDSAGSKRSSENLLRLFPRG